MVCIKIILLKQQLVGRHVALLGHIVMIPSKPVFNLSFWSRVLFGEAADTNVMLVVVGLTCPGFEPMISRTRNEHANQYTTGEV